MLMRQCHNYIEAPKLPQRWVLGLTHNILWILYWQRCFNFKITKSNSRCLHNIDSTESWEAEKAFIINLFRSSRQRCSVKKGVLRNFTKFTAKHLHLFFHKFAGRRPLLKKRLWRVFSCEFCEISPPDDDCFWILEVNFLDYQMQ